jgi:regulator of RNase E activity RraA
MAIKSLLTEEDLDALRQFDTCMVSNAIETFGTRLRNTGFADGSIRSMFQDAEAPPMVGYAATARLRSGEPPIVGGSFHDRTAFWNSILEIPEPRILVLEDMDKPPGRGAFLGDMHAAILQALGCIGYLTNGAVRELPAVRAMRFQLFAGSVAVSHAYAHIFDLRQITLSSELVPFQEIDVYAKESGYVQKLNVDYGTHVKTGQTMATLEIPELQAQLEQDEAEIKNAMNQVSRADHELQRYDAQYNALHLQYTRLNQVFETQPGIVAQQEVDDAQGKDLAASSQVDAGKQRWKRPRASWPRPKRSSFTTRLCSTIPESRRHSPELLPNATRTWELWFRPEPIRARRQCPSSACLRMICFGWLFRFPSRTFATFVSGIRSVSTCLP